MSVAGEEKKEAVTLELTVPSRKKRISPALDVALWLLVWVPLVVGGVVLLAWLFWALGRASDETGEFTLYAVLAWLFVPILIAAGGTLIGLGISVLLRSLSSVRRERAQLVLGYLENAIRLNFPLDRFLEAAQGSERGIRRLRLIDLREALRQGMPVGTALMTAVPEMPEETARSLMAAEGIGTLQRAIVRLMRRDDRAATSEPQTTPFYRFYCPMMILGGGGLLLFVAVFVMPKFREIFKDFHSTLPPLTAHVFGLVEAFTESSRFLPLLMLLLLVSALLLVARGLQHSVQRLRGIQRRPFFMGLSFRWLPWYVPVWRRLVMDRCFVEIFEFISDALRSEVPLIDAVGAAESLGLPSAMRWQLNRWRREMLSGRTPAEAGRTARLPAVVVGFLATGAASAASTETFAFLSQYYRARFSRLAVLLRAAAEPAAVLVLGVLVGVVVYSLFIPLVTLIDAVLHSSERGFL